MPRIIVFDSLWSTGCLSGVFLFPHLWHLSGFFLLSFILLQKKKRTREEDFPTHVCESGLLVIIVYLYK